jgi:hypothetical protein
LYFPPQDGARVERELDGLHDDPAVVVVVEE